ncbi:hypothetical protein KFE25_011913 [Diacronema lutheri]|uniref:Uncharacterized protein n=1 Tax=Diacronema lutheri TaxID=2081491 RepID=A0A8J5XBF9_DIALT|nr:hypothetical protein KFE25_011913 [Diacronema lutheri]
MAARAVRRCAELLRDSPWSEAAGQAVRALAELVSEIDEGSAAVALVNALGEAELVPALVVYARAAFGEGDASLPFALVALSILTNVADVGGTRVVHAGGGFALLLELLRSPHAQARHYAAVGVQNMAHDEACAREAVGAGALGALAALTDTHAADPTDETLAAIAAAAAGALANLNGRVPRLALVPALARAHDEAGACAALRVEGARRVRWHAVTQLQAHARGLLARERARSDGERAARAVARCAVRLRAGRPTAAHARALEELVGALARAHADEAQLAAMRAAREARLPARLVEMALESARSGERGGATAAVGALTQIARLRPGGGRLLVDAEALPLCIWLAHAPDHALRALGLTCALTALDERTCFTDEAWRRAQESLQLEDRLWGMATAGAAGDGAGRRGDEDEASDDDDAFVDETPALAHAALERLAGTDAYARAHATTVITRLARGRWGRARAVALRMAAEAAEVKAAEATAAFATSDLPATRDVECAVRLQATVRARAARVEAARRRATAAKAADAAAEAERKAARARAAAAEAARANRREHAAARVQAAARGRSARELAADARDARDEATLRAAAEARAADAAARAATALALVAQADALLAAAHALDASRANADGAPAADDAVGAADVRAAPRRPAAAGESAPGDASGPPCRPGAAAPAVDRPASRAPCAPTASPARRAGAAAIVDACAVSAARARHGAARVIQARARIRAACMEARRALSRARVAACRIGRAYRAHVNARIPVRLAAAIVIQRRARLWLVTRARARAVARGHASRTLELAAAAATDEAHLRVEAVQLAAMNALGGSWSVQTARLEPQRLSSSLGAGMARAASEATLASAVASGAATRPLPMFVLSDRERTFARAHKVAEAQLMAEQAAAEAVAAQRAAMAEAEAAEVGAALSAARIQALYRGALARRRSLQLSAAVAASLLPPRSPRSPHARDTAAALLGAAEPAAAALSPSTPLGSARAQHATSPLHAQTRRPTLAKRASEPPAPSAAAASRAQLATLPAALPAALPVIRLPADARPGARTHTDCSAECLSSSSSSSGSDKSSSSASSGATASAAAAEASAAATQAAKGEAAAAEASAAATQAAKGERDAPERVHYPLSTYARLPAHGGARAISGAGARSPNRRLPPLRAAHTQPACGNDALSRARALGAAEPLLLVGAYLVGDGGGSKLARMEAVATVAARLSAPAAAHPRPAAAARSSCAVRAQLPAEVRHTMALNRGRQRLLTDMGLLTAASTSLRGPNTRAYGLQPLLSSPSP